MIEVDPREGSEPLVDELLVRGLPARAKLMQFGDVRFMGKDHTGMPVLIGIEVKKVRDLVNCIHDKRFSAHQLPGMLDTYHRSYLFVYGPHREFEGQLQIVSGRGHWQDLGLSFDTFMNWRTTHQEYTGITIELIPDWERLVADVARLYRWWERGDKHKSHLAVSKIYRPPAGVSLGNITLLRRVANSFDDMKWERSAAAETRFATTEDMINASVAEWKEVEGVGPVLAERWFKAIRTKGAL